LHLVQYATGPAQSRLCRFGGLVIWPYFTPSVKEPLSKNISVTDH
jgi:hypothetical protein